MTTGYRFINRQYMDLLSAWRGMHHTRLFHVFIAGVISEDLMFVGKAFHDKEDHSFNAVLLAQDEYGGYSFRKAVTDCIGKDSAIVAMKELMENAIKNHKGGCYHQGHDQISVFKNPKKLNHPRRI